ncbi:MAG: hypothetical protein R3F34_01565 [Planctomycetota bacterium]
MFALALYLAIRSAWVTDDAFIAFNYSKHLALGEGLRFNAGESPPVEGYTQLGWVLLVALIERLRLEVVSATHVVEIATFLALVAVAMAATRRGSGSAAALLAGLFVATAPTSAIWATGGLGTMLFALAILVSTLAVLRASGSWSLGLAIVSTIAVTVVRFDGLWFAGLIVLGAGASGFVRADRRLVRTAITVGVAVAIGFALQTWWRVEYHGDYVPNTVRAKLGTGTWRLERGANYVLAYFLAIPTAAALALVTVVRAVRERQDRDGPLLAVSATVVLGTFVHAVVSGGDFMPMWRLLVPAVAPLAIVLGSTVVAIGRRASGGDAAALVAAALVGWVPASFGASLAPRSWFESVEFRPALAGVSESRLHSAWREQIGTRIRDARILASATGPGESIVLGAIGTTGYYTELEIHDRFGLVDRDVARLVPATPGGGPMPGHDRLAPIEFFANRRPTYLATKFYPGEHPGTPLHDAFVTTPAYATGDFVLVDIGVDAGFGIDGTLVLTRYRVAGTAADDGDPRADD